MKSNVKEYTRQFYKNNVINFLLTLFATLCGAVNALLISWLLQQLTDLIGGYETGFSLLQLVVISVALVACCVVTELISWRFQPKFITKAISQYKQYVFVKLTKKNIAAFSKENTSTYISALTNDVQTVEQGYLCNTFSTISSLLTFAGALALMILYSPMLTLVAFGFSLLPLLASVFTGNAVAKREKDVSDRNEIYTSAINDSLGGFSVIKSFKAEAQMIKLFKQNVQELAKAQCAKQKMRILVQMFASVAGLIAQLGVFIFGAYLAISGEEVTAGTTIVFVQLMNYVISPIATVPTFIAERKAAKILIGKISAALDANMEETGRCGRVELEQGIRVKDLSFCYEEGAPVLKNVSCTFEKGKKYAVVGASGSGKSTLLNLLMASDANYGGEILYDQTELRQIASDNLYEMQSIIQQSVFVFNATVRDNVTMFGNFPQEQIDRAIRLSGLDGLIAEKGEDYLCGENGSGLSGGEKQRISIARSLLKNAQVLLVDEATSALDRETAFKVSGSILELDGVTCVVVTHALDEELLNQYDGIVAIKNGCVAEQGTFAELMAKRGYFYSLFTVAE